MFADCALEQGINNYATVQPALMEYVTLKGLLVTESHFSDMAASQIEKYLVQNI